MKKLLIHLLHKIPSKGFFRFYFRQINKTNSGMVITLHRVTTADNLQKNGLNEFIEISDKNLERVIINLRKLNAQFVSLQELEQGLRNGKKQQPMVHISFDDGYEDTFTAAYPVLKRYNVPFSIFITSDFIDNDDPFLWWYLVENIIKNETGVIFEKYGFEVTADMYHSTSHSILFERFRNFMLENVDQDKAYFREKLNSYNKGGDCIPKMLSWEQINTMVGSGLCEIGVHTKSHARFSKLNTGEKISEISACKAEIYKHTGIDATFFAYPYGSSTDIGDDDPLDTIMHTCGIRSAFTTNARELNSQSDRYHMSRIFLNNSTTMYTLKTRLDGTYQRDPSVNRT